MTLRPQRGSDQSDTFRLDDLPGDRKLIDICAWTLRSAVDSGPFLSGQDRDIRYSVRNVRASADVLAFEVVKGTSGIRSELHKPGEEVFERDEKHREDIAFRALILFPPNGYHAFLMLERVGTNGVAGFIRKLLLDTFRSNLDRVKTAIDPLATAADLAGLQASVKALTFRMPLPSDRSARREAMRSVGGTFQFKWTARSRKRIEQFTDEDGNAIDSTKVFGVLSDGLGMFGSGMTAARASELGVEADLTLNVGQRQRTFTLGTDDGPSIVYPIASGDGAASEEPTGPPSDPDFVATCKRVVEDLDGRYNVSQVTPNLVVLPTAPAGGSLPDSWKAEWHVAVDDPASN